MIEGHPALECYNAVIKMLKLSSSEINNYFFNNDFLNKYKIRKETFLIEFRNSNCTKEKFKICLNSS